jgi:hypothetical protein
MGRAWFHRHKTPIPLKIRALFIAIGASQQKLFPPGARERTIHPRAGYLARPQLSLEMANARGR